MKNIRAIKRMMMRPWPVSLDILFFSSRVSYVCVA